MKTYYFLSFLIFVTSFCSAQQEWVTGSVVLKNDQVLVGELSKKPIRELILMKSSDGVKVLPAHQVAYYRFYDKDNDINRQFLSVKTHALFGAAKFFEIVIQGNVKVLRRYHKKTPEDQLDEAYDFDYFALVDKSLVPLARFKTEVYPVLVQKYPIEMATFVSVNQLRLASIPSVFSIIKHFNAIDRHSNVLAQVD